MSTQLNSSPNSCTGRGLGLRLPVFAKSTAVLFETLNNSDVRPRQCTHVNLPNPPWLIAGSQSVWAGGRSHVLAMLVPRLDWLTWLPVWQTLYLPCSSFAHKRNLTCNKVSDGSNTAWSLHVWILVTNNTQNRHAMMAQVVWGWLYEVYLLSIFKDLTTRFLLFM
jgi:hypothetical protein